MLVATWWTRSAFHGRPKIFSGTEIFLASTPFCVYKIVSILLASNFHQSSSAAWNSTANEQFPCFRLDRNDSQVFSRNAVASHSAGHALAFGHPAAVAPAAADRSRLALAVLLAVRSRSAVKTVALDHALEALAFGN